MKERIKSGEILRDVYRTAGATKAGIVSKHDSIVNISKITSGLITNGKDYAETVSRQTGALKDSIEITAAMKLAPEEKLELIVECAFLARSHGFGNDPEIVQEVLLKSYSYLEKFPIKT